MYTCTISQSAQGTFNWPLNIWSNTLRFPTHDLHTYSQPHCCKMTLRLIWTQFESAFTQRSYRTRLSASHSNQDKPDSCRHSKGSKSLRYHWRENCCTPHQLMWMLWRRQELAGLCTESYPAPKTCRHNGQEVREVSNLTVWMMYALCRCIFICAAIQGTNGTPAFPSHASHAAVFLNFW